MIQLYIGIDPGANGGIALVGQTGLLVAVAKCSGPVDAWQFIHAQNAVGASCLIVLEGAPHHCPSAKAVRAVALAVGELLGFLTAKMPFANILMPQAQEWQKVMLKAPKGQTKPYALAVANNLFRGENWLATSRSKVPHDGMIDAALLAYYGFQLGPKK